MLMNYTGRNKYMLYAPSAFHPRSPWFFSAQIYTHILAKASSVQNNSLKEKEQFQYCIIFLATTRDFQKSM